MSDQQNTTPHGVDVVLTLALLVLCEGESTCPTGGIPYKALVVRTYAISLLLYWTNCKANNGVSSDLRSHDVQVTSL